MTLPMDTLSDDILTLTQLYQLDAALAQIAKNLQLINVGENGNVIVTQTANLFRLAAQYYGDATLWTNIAIANNLHDPQVISDSPLSILIPANTVDSGGILQP